MKKVMRKLSVLALVCCMVLGLGIGVRANTSAVSSRAASTNLALGATATANDVERRHELYGRSGHRWQ